MFVVPRPHPTAGKSRDNSESSVLQSTNGSARLAPGNDGATRTGKRRVDGFRETPGRPRRTYVEGEPRREPTRKQRSGCGLPALRGLEGGRHGRRDRRKQVRTMRRIGLARRRRGGGRQRAQDRK